MRQQSVGVEFRQATATALSVPFSLNTTVKHTEAVTLLKVIDETRFNRKLVKGARIRVLIHKWFCLLIVAHGASSAYGMSLDSVVDGARTQRLLTQPYSLRRTEIVCPDGMAVLLPEPYPDAGTYISCEKLDTYVGLLETGRTVEASRLTLRQQTQPKEGL